MCKFVFPTGGGFHLRTKESVFPLCLWTAFNWFDGGFGSRVLGLVVHVFSHLGITAPRVFELGMKVRLLDAEQDGGSLYWTWPWSAGRLRKEIYG